MVPARVAAIDRGTVIDVRQFSPLRSTSFSGGTILSLGLLVLAGVRGGWDLFAFVFGLYHIFLLAWSLFTILS